MAPIASSRASQIIESGGSRSPRKWRAHEASHARVRVVADHARRNQDFLLTNPHASPPILLCASTCAPTATLYGAILCMNLPLFLACQADTPPAQEARSSRNRSLACDNRAQPLQHDTTPVAH